MTTLKQVSCEVPLYEEESSDSDISFEFADLASFEPQDIPSGVRAP